MVRTKSVLASMLLLMACDPAPSREAMNASSVIAAPLPQDGNACVVTDCSAQCGGTNDQLCLLACESANAACRHKTCEQSCAAQCAARFPPVQGLAQDGSDEQDCEDLCVAAKCDSPKTPTCTTDPDCAFACDLSCMYFHPNDEQTRAECRTGCNQRCPCATAVQSTGS